MNVGVRNLALALMIALVLLGCLQTSAESAYAQNDGAVIDIFTQKQPFSGKGLNVTSDAFAPGENVIIYALVTYNGFPVSSMNVAFEVQGPANPVQNVTIFNSAQTNTSGIAAINFRIGSLSEINFGGWIAEGNVNVGDVIARDFLFFKVGWIVEITDIRTINKSNIEQTDFSRESYVGVELTLRNIAMTKKNATLTICIYDSMNVLVNSTEINYISVPPNESLVTVTRFLFIPKTSMSGTAKIDAGASTAPVSLGGVPYSPKVSKLFYIANSDISILDVQSYPDTAYEGETVLINVSIKNKGDITENFNTSAYYNGTSIGTLNVTGLQPGSYVTVSFDWNTSSVSDGFYQISASAGPVLGEVAVMDNYFEDGIVQVKSPDHDVAIVGVSPSSWSTYVGQTLEINVIAENHGSFTESFNVTAFYNSTAIGTLLVKNLGPGEQKELAFNWNTDNVKEGNYTLSARASLVPGETDVENNYFIDGEIEIKAAPGFVPLSILFMSFLLLLLLLILILLIIWLYNRERRKQSRARVQSQFSRVLPKCFTA